MQERNAYFLEIQLGQVRQHGHIDRVLGKNRCIFGQALVLQAKMPRHSWCFHALLIASYLRPNFDLLQNGGGPVRFE